MTSKYLFVISAAFRQCQKRIRNVQVFLKHEVIWLHLLPYIQVNLGLSWN